MSGHSPEMSGHSPEMSAHKLERPCQINVQEIVEAIHKTGSKTPPISPVPKPRKLVPHSNEIRMVTPPTSPMRRRANHTMVSSNEKKPKPPIRKRKGKFSAPTEGGTASEQQGQSNAPTEGGTASEQQGQSNAPTEGGTASEHQGQSNAPTEGGTASEQQGQLKVEGQDVEEKVKTDRIEEQDKQEKQDEPEKQDQDEPEKQEEADEPEEQAKPEKLAEPEKQDNPEREDKPDEPEKQDGPERPDEKSEPGEQNQPEESTEPAQENAIPDLPVQQVEQEDDGEREVENGELEVEEICINMNEDEESSESSDSPAEGADTLTVRVVGATPEPEEMAEKGSHNGQTEESNQAKTNDAEAAQDPELPQSQPGFAVTKKKKPPPLPPPPYQRQTPPLPSKQRKAFSMKVRSSRDSSNRSADSSSPEKRGSTGVKMVHGPIYEEVDPMDSSTAVPVTMSIDPSKIMSRPETFANKHLSSGSYDSGWNADSVPTSPSASLSSLENGFKDGPNSSPPRMVRGSTVSSAERSQQLIRRKSAPLKMKARPVSEYSRSGLFDSFEVIPGASGKLEDVMLSMREYDERLQDANIYELIQACAKAMPHTISTTDLPPRVPDFPVNTRALVIHELYTTEYTYVKGLEVLLEVFQAPLSVILGDETGSIFANVPDILEFNKGFLALLHSRLDNWDSEQCLGDLFIGMFTQSHKSMYAIYCSNYDTAEMLVHQKIRKKKEFEQALQLSLASPRVIPGLTLTAYLITPVQRITRYILLLKDIIKKTPEDHPDYRNLVKALERMGELADYIDAQVRESQTKKTFESLKNKVHGLADLESPDRSLVKEGQVYLKSIKKLYQCILFNDMLVFALGDSKQSTVELQLSLEAVWIEDLEDLDPQTSHEDAIEIYTPERPYTIYTRTSSEKRLWLAKLRETIYHHLHTAGKCLRSDSFDTAERHATFFYADNRVYSGHYVDARRHGKGTMTWPNKTLYVGDWVDDERCGEGEFTYNTGDVYRGRWHEDRQNGMGELQFASNDIYRGYWKDGVRHGTGKILYANGDMFDGHFVSGQIDGRGRLRCINGVEFDGEWKQSQRHGLGTLKTVTGNVYSGNFRYNLIHGHGIMEYKTGEKYEGSWKNGVRQGQGKLESQMIGTYEGSWERDMQHGRGKMLYPNGDVYDGGWELNKRHGKGVLHYATGKVYAGEFKNDLIHGEGEMKYSEVSKYHGSFINGLRQGSGTMVYADHSSYNGDWQKNLRHGQGELVKADGSVYRGLWAEDMYHGKGTLHIPAANYTYIGDFVTGKREGRGEEISQYGNYKGSWKNDMKQGHGEERTLVGTIFEGTWERSRKNGRGVRKMVFGTVEEQVWKSGNLISDPQRMTAVELPYISRNDY